MKLLHGPLHRCILLILLLPLLGARAASAFSLHGGLTYSSPVGSEGLFKPLSGYGGGFLHEIRSRRGSTGFEFGATYWIRRFSDSSGSTTFTSNLIEIPLLLRLNGKIFSLGLGGYISKALGTLQIASSTGTTQGEYRQTLDYGGAASLRFQPRNSRIFVDARYLHGLMNVGSTSAVYYRSYQLFLGLRFGNVRTNSY